MEPVEFEKQLAEIMEMINKNLQKENERNKKFIEESLAINERIATALEAIVVKLSSGF
jgi:hypothetical protein